MAAEGPSPIPGDGPTGVGKGKRPFFEAVQRGPRAEWVAETMGVSRSTVFGWMARDRAGGWDALKAKPVPGRPPKITGSQVEWICRTIAGKTPLQYRFEFALWTLDLVRWRIGERCGIRLEQPAHGAG